MVDKRENGLNLCGKYRSGKKGRLGNYIFFWGKFKPLLKKPFSEELYFCLATAEIEGGERKVKIGEPRSHPRSVQADGSRH